MREWRWSKPNVPYAERTSRRFHSPPTKTKTTSYQDEEEKYFKNTQGNKRDENARRLAEREIVSQISRNPFLEMLNECEDENHSSGYIKDLTIQDLFLRPQDSNISKQHNK